MNMKNYIYGLRKGLPIGLGYLFVSFSFGVMAVNKGLSPLMTIIISLTNLTSSGQYAGVELIVKNASYVELFLTILLINLRYSLMSISLSQKIEDDIPTGERLIFGFGITDEVYALAITEHRKVTFGYMMGLITLPIVMWTLGTALGALCTNVMPQKFLNAMDIALYAMFIAIIFPDARKNYKVLIIILIAVAISCLFYYTPVIKKIGLGFKIIIATVVSATLGAILFPKEDDTNV